MRIPFLTQETRRARPAPPAPEEDVIDDKPMPLLEHLIELRRRLMWSLAAFLLAFFVCYHFSGRSVWFLAEPLAKVEERLGGSRRLIYTSLTEGFFTYLKVAMFGGAFIAFPVMATQLWLFVAPGLYRSEKTGAAAVPAGHAGAVRAGRGAGLLFRVPVRLGFFLSFQTPQRRRRAADRAGAAGRRNISTW